MTDNPANPQAEALRLPDPPPKGFVPFTNFIIPGTMTTLAEHLDVWPDKPDCTTLVSGYGYICRSQDDIPLCPVPDPMYPDPRDPDTRYPYPDMVVAFDVDPDSIIEANGYVIDDVGKPPDLVLEVGSSYNGRREYAGLLETYARLGVPEFWTFDHSWNHYYDQPLACDLLTPGGNYRPKMLTVEPNGVIWGYSEVLGLSICWVEARILFWDRAQQCYLPNLGELTDNLDLLLHGLDPAKARVVASETRTARDALIRAHARIHQLEEELRRRDNP